MVLVVSEKIDWKYIAHVSFVDIAGRDRVGPDQFPQPCRREFVHFVIVSRAQAKTSPTSGGKASMNASSADEAWNEYTSPSEWISRVTGPPGSSA
jgi:hypothetical protein